jgi:hypothetical protein
MYVGPSFSAGSSSGLGAMGRFSRRTLSRGRMDERIAVFALSTKPSALDGGRSPGHPTATASPSRTRRLRRSPTPEATSMHARSMTAVAAAAPRSSAARARRSAAGVLSATALVAALAASPADAQTANTPTPETFRKTMIFRGQFNNEPLETITMYTVPANRYFRITDIILTNYYDLFCDISISKMYEIRIQPNSTLPITLASGPTYEPGEVISVTSTWRLPGHGDNCRPLFTIMGYTFTQP